MKWDMYSSLLLSIFMQVATGLLDVVALFVKVPSSFLLVKELLVLELLVQIIEGAFYIYWFFNFTSIANITPKRYFDWFLTTPTMLITLMFYLIFLKNKEENREDAKELHFFDLFKQEFNTIVTVLGLNWLMLLFGYLSEINVLPVLLGVALGFIPFLIYYYIIYQKYAVSSGASGSKIFWYFFIFWGLYGVAAVLPYKLKNMGYNLLDLFAKNFFGVFLSYLVFTNAI